MAWPSRSIAEPGDRTRLPTPCSHTRSSFVLSPDYTLQISQESGFTIKRDGPTTSEQQKNRRIDIINFVHSLLMPRPILVSTDFETISV